MAGALLVVVGGLPGTGKTTIADELAVQLARPVFNKDRIEASLWRDGVTGALGEKAVDMTLRLDNAGALPTCPQQQQQQVCVA